jgi:hypothetical protein
MKNHLTWILLLAIALFSGALYYFFVYKAYPKYAWYTTLRPAGKQPFDLDIFYEILKSNQTGVGITTNKSSGLHHLELKKKHQAYIFIQGGNGQPNYRDADVDSLISFLEEGGVAFFGCHSLGEKLSARLLREEASELILLSAISSKPEIPALRSPLGLYGAKPTQQVWFTNPGPAGDVPIRYHYFEMNGEWFYLKNGCKILGTIGNEVNYLEIPVGKGKIFWHSMPEVFGNVYLKNKPFFHYADRITSAFQLKQTASQVSQKDSWWNWTTSKLGQSGKTILVDEAAKIPFTEDTSGATKSPLKYL